MTGAACSCEPSGTPADPRPALPSPPAPARAQLKDAQELAQAAGAEAALRIKGLESDKHHLGLSVKEAQEAAQQLGAQLQEAAATKADLEQQLDRTTAHLDATEVCAAWRPGGLAAWPFGWLPGAGGGARTRGSGAQLSRAKRLVPLRAEGSGQPCVAISSHAAGNCTCTQLAHACACTGAACAARPAPDEPRSHQSFFRS